MISTEKIERQFYALDDEMLERIVREITSEDLSVVRGGILERFECATAEFFGARHAIAACNGTAALHLALFALDIQPGDEVLIPAYGYYAMALPVCMLGGAPVFCDIRENDLTLDVDKAEKLISQRTRAVIVHQPWGCPADVDRLQVLADRYGLSLISDSSHAHGALWKGRSLGQYYDFVCTSFGKGKLISGGELGVATTNNDRYRDRMLLFGHVNRVPQALITPDYKHLHNSIGVKYRPHPFAMALALEQLQSYPERSQRLIEKARSFERGVQDIAGFNTFSTPKEASRVYWRIPVRLDPGLGSPSSIVERLQEHGCPVERKGGLLIPEHNSLTEFYGVKNRRRYPVAERMQTETIQVQVFAFVEELKIEKTLSIFRALAQKSKFTNHANSAQNAT